MPSTKTNALILFKFKSYWEQLFIDTLSHEFNIVKTIHANELIADVGTKQLINIVNQQIIDTGSTTIFIDADYYPAIDFTLIEKISNVKKVLVTFDDLVFHDRNSITAALGHCSVVLTADPISKLKYEEKMINAHILFHDCTVPQFDKVKIDKETDILFFGSLAKGGRGVYINYLKENGINIKTVAGVSQEDLIKEIRGSKIILNLSMTDEIKHLTNYGYSETSPFSIYLQFKLRIIEAGLLGSACISEFAPGISLMFQENEVPVFHNKEECLEIVRNLLQNENQLNDITRKLKETVFEKYESTPLMASVADKIKHSDYNTLVVHVPSWYYIDTLTSRFITAGHKKGFVGVLRELTHYDFPGRYWFSFKNIHIALSSVFKYTIRILYRYKSSILKKIKS